MKYGTAKQDEFIEFWMKIFNPLQYQSILKTEFMDTLEKLARGQFTESPTLISLKYSKGFYQMLVDKGCVKDENGDVIVDKFIRKIKKGEINIEYLNQTLKQDCEFILEDDDVNFVD